MFWNLYYKFQDWKCRTFGHRKYWETNVKPHHWACKRGCGPIDVRKENENKLWDRQW